MRTVWSRLTAAISLLAALGLWGCNPADQELMDEQSHETPASDISQTSAAVITPQALDAAAQRGVSFIVQDTSSWLQGRADACGACHRVGAPLYGASLAAYTGYDVNTNTTNGTGYLAQFLANEQLANGQWIHAGAHYPFIKSSYAAFGLAGYTQYSNTLYQGNLQRAIDWAIGATANIRHSNPMDGQVLQGVSSVYVPQDHGHNPVTLNWPMPTAHFAVATRALLDVGAAIPAPQRQNYQLFLRNLADSLMGQYARSNGSWLPQDVAYALIGSIQDGRTPANTPTVASMRDELLNRYTGGGWGDASIGNPNIYATGVALYALCLAEVRSDVNTTVANALNWLANQQCTVTNNYCGTGTAAKNGSWVMPNIAGDVPSTFATLAMGCYGSRGVSVTLEPAPSVQLAPGLSSPQTTSFQVRVRNTGYSTNTFALVTSGSWPNIEVSNNLPSMTLNPGSEAVSTVTVTVPAFMPESVRIPISVQVSYRTLSGLVSRVVTFEIIIPRMPENGQATRVTILSPLNNPIIAPGTAATLSARVNRQVDNSPVTLGTLTFFSAGAAIATVQADVSGNFTYSWPVPSTAQLGPQTFTARYSGYATNNLSININPSSADGTFTIGYPNGSVCATNAECSSGLCVDGVCCNSACGGGNPNDCQACSRFAGAQSDGTCGTVRAGVTCRLSRGFCDASEVCDGSSTACPADVFDTGGTKTCTVGGGACNSGECTTPLRGLRARFYNNTTLTEPFVWSPSHNSINFDWGTGTPNTMVLPSGDSFSARWVGDVLTPTDPALEPGKFTGQYTFLTQSDEGVRLWVNGKLIIDNWTSHTTTVDRGTIFLESNKRYSVVLEYYEGSGNANIILQWQPPQSLPQVITSPATGTPILTPAINNPVPVRISSPLNRTTYAGPANIVIDVEAVAITSSITSVEFFRDGQPIGTDTTAPFSLPVNGLQPGVYLFTARATAANGLQQTSAPVAVSVVPSPLPGATTGSGLLADYYNGSNFNSFQFTRTEYSPGPDAGNFNPLPPDVIRPDNFSVRYTGTVVPAYSQSYTFSVQTNGTARVWINNSLAIDTSTGTSSAPIGVTAGQLVPIRIEYRHGNAQQPLFKIFWRSQSEPTSLITGTRLFPAAVSSR